ncbi:MAG: aspartate kinase, partial [Vicinamibacterales bacterium]|nr:aspartate kinase [Vicinamibacterales bacterium]
MSRADGLVVQKYGGTSISNPDKVIAVAERVKRRLATVKRLVVVVSAMGDSTDELVALAQKVSRQPQGREMDLLLASGEQVAVSTLSLALQDRGVDAISLTAAQCGIRTDGVFNLARIRSIDTRRIVGELDAGRVVIITGFQGITESDEITTLGRGGSDVTGAAVAAALGASVCEICTDVAGVLSADPRLVVGARKWSEISYEEAIELASSGAKVLHPRAAEICMSYEIPIHVRSSFTDESGTWIRSGGSIMEQAEVVGVTSDKEIAKITLLDVADQAGYHYTSEQMANP